MTITAKPRPSVTPSPAPAEQDQHPVVGLLHFLFVTAPGRVLLLAVVLGLLALFSPAARVVLAPIWRLLTGGLVFETPGPWDSTWLYGAPERPQARPNFRGERFPRTRWGRMPGYQRMAIRWAVLGYLWALVVHPWVTLPVSVAVVVVIVVHRIVRVVRDWGLRRAAGLFADGAAALLGYGDRPAATWIAVPRLRIVLSPIPVAPVLLRAARRVPRIGDRLEHLLGDLAVPVLRVPLDADDAEVRIKLDAQLTNKEVVQRVGELALERLPDGPWQAHHKHRELHVVLTHPKRPPSDVWYDAEANQQYAVDDVPIAKSADGWETLPLKRLTPHVVGSASTGWGKTTLANVYIAHTAGNGGYVLINDPKRIGFIRAFGGLKNVRIKTTTAGFIANIDLFNAEMQRRYEIIEQHPEIADDPELYFQPWFMVTDEKGSMVSVIRSWWKDEMGEKGTPPPLLQEKINLWQARAAAMYMLDLAQQANLDVFLDSDGRDQRMARIAAGPQTRSSWMMLFPGIAKVKALMKKGRAMLGIGPDNVKEVQLAQVSIEDARRFATAGAAIADKENAARAERLSALLGESVRPETSGTLPGQTDPSVPGQSQDGQTEELTRENAPRQPFSIIPGQSDRRAGDNSGAPASAVADDNVKGPEKDPVNTIVGLQNAAKYLGMSDAAFEKARRRRPIDGETRRGAQPVWTVLDLKEWRAQAPRAGRPASGDE
jgi:hypothetical protein